MIARLRGNVLEIAEDSLVVDVQGVGYLVYASPRVLRELPAVGGAVDLVVETLVREDAIQLVGFTSLAEKRLFRLLQGIQGVGTRLALAILGVLDPLAFERAVVARDKAALTRAPGVGPRLAQRVIAELEGRVGGLVTAGEAPPAAGAPAAEAGPVEQTVTALAQLGYARSEAHTAAQQAVGELGASADLATVLRRALQILGTRLG